MSRKFKFKKFCKAGLYFYNIYMVFTKKEFDFICSKSPGSLFYVKFDLGLKKVKVLKAETTALIDDRLKLDLNIKIKSNFLYYLDESGVEKISFFSQNTNRFYKLVPTHDWPTISIGSVPMHRLKSPLKDTQSKIRALRPYGYCMDTCMGMGYTAFLLAKEAKKVITFEKDENVFLLARLNPFSRKMFSTHNITIKKDDVAQGILKIKSGCFDCILHDPPTLKLAGELYSDRFYSQMHRVLQRRGRLFHYTPLYKIKQGFDFPATIMRRLKKTGFKNLVYARGAGGIICSK